MPPGLLLLTLLWWVLLSLCKRFLISSKNNLDASRSTYVDFIANLCMRREFCSYAPRLGSTGYFILFTNFLLLNLVFKLMVFLWLRYM
jgi:hypothetical protein